jgi:pSer/pThr/pTyr-binding forkhead associated (FHA) protein
MLVHQDRPHLDGSIGKVRRDNWRSGAVSSAWSIVCVLSSRLSSTDAVLLEPSMRCDAYCAVAFTRGDMREPTAPGLPLSTWTIDDEVVRLRIRDTDVVHQLPSPESEAAEEGSVIGTSPECDIRLVDPSGRTSRRHAKLVRDQSQWTLRDLGSKNGIRIGRSTILTVILEPATEVEIGGLTLLAESERSIELRSFLARLLGSLEGPGGSVDTALRCLRMAQTRQVPVVLRGEEDLVELARDLHRRVYPSERPFVIYASHHRVYEQGDMVRAPNFADGKRAMVVATGGTLCLLTSSLPADYEEVWKAYSDSEGTHTQVIVCDDVGDDEMLLLYGAIVVPRLSDRTDELPHIIEAYAR